MAAGFVEWTRFLQTVCVVVRSAHADVLPLDLSRVLAGQRGSSIQEAGGTPYVVPAGDAPFVRTPDGPDGPIDLGVPTEHIERWWKRLESRGGRLSVGVTR